MKTFGTTAALAVALLSASNLPSAEAGRRCGRPGGRPAHVYRVVAAQPVVLCSPQPYATAAAIPAQYFPQPTPQAVVAAPPVQPPATQAAPGGLPSYAYQSTPGGSPAYYLTYDKDDRMIPMQWVDWLFRGGRDAGEPRPPLPIIGRLQDR